MLETTKRYTPNGVAYMITCKRAKLKELHDQRVATAHRKQEDHPRYMQMTEREFKLYIIEAIRYNRVRAKEIEAEIEELEKIRW